MTVPFSFGETAIPNGVFSGDATSTSAVMWTRAIALGPLTFQISSDPLFGHEVKTKQVTVTDSLVPVKVEFDDLKPSQEYFYRATDAGGNVVEGQFDAAANLVITLGSTAYANQPPETLHPLPLQSPATALHDFEVKHSETYSNRPSMNTVTALQDTTAIVSGANSEKIIDTTVPLTFDETAFPNGVSSGDVTQTSAVVWTHAVDLGPLTFQVSTDPSFSHGVKTQHVTVTDPLVPVKAEFGNLKPGQEYFYRAIDADGHVAEGQFGTAANLGAHAGLNFGVIGDIRGDLGPYPSISNAATANLDLVIKLGDTVYADQPPDLFHPTVPPGALPPATTLEDFQLKQNEVYSSHLGINSLAALQSTTPVLSMIDDHEVVDNFAGGAPPSSDPRFTGPGNFINETSLYTNGLQAFNQYNAIENRTYSGTGEARFDGAPDLYRYNTYGSDAAIIMTDARSFRDTELASGNGILVQNPQQFLSEFFDPSRTMLGDVQLNQLENDLLDARDKGITWKFVTIGEEIQNVGPFDSPNDRFEGYAAERNALLKFIDQNHIDNVVFVTSDTHWFSVNNLTYQDSVNGPQIATNAIDVNTMPTAALPLTGTLVVPLAFQFGLIPQAVFDAYNAAPTLAVKDAIDKQVLDGLIAQFGYDPIGLNDNLPAADGKIHAQLLQGDYFVGHDYGWSDFNIDATTGDLTVTSYGIPGYGFPGAPGVLDPNSTPTIVSQFVVNPQSGSIIGTAGNDHLNGTSGADVILGAAGNDVLNGGDGNDYLDGGKGNDVVFGGNGDDHIFGRDGNDTLYGQAGNDIITGGAGNDTAFGGDGNDTFVATIGDGNDSYFGGSGIDTLDLSGTKAPAKVSLEQGTAQSTDIGHDQLSSVENVTGGSGADQITGDSGSNRLDGGPGADTIDGRAGNDVIIGGAGNDKLTGEKGNDTFIFHVGFGNDTITDFSVGDVIQFDKASVPDFNAVLTATTDIGADLKITVGADSITLKNVASVDNLHTNDFLFV